MISTIDIVRRLDSVTLCARLRAFISAQIRQQRMFWMMASLFDEDISIKGEAHMCADLAPSTTRSRSGGDNETNKLSFSKKNCMNDEAPRLVLSSQVKWDCDRFRLQAQRSRVGSALVLIHLPSICPQLGGYNKVIVARFRELSHAL